MDDEDVSCTPLLDKGTQTDMKMVAVASVQTEPLSIPHSVSIVPCFIPAPNNPHTLVRLIANDNDATQFYTGLSSWNMFEYLVSTVSPVSEPACVKLFPADGLFLTLMRLRLNLTVKDLAYRFNISVTTVTRVFSKYIDCLFLSLKCLIRWPSQAISRINLPPIFKELYPTTRCIIDCTEIFIERPYAFKPRAQTYSNYKKHNTIKLLIGVTPCGAVSFLSKCWGGRASDRCIMVNSGILSLFENGDVVLADRGFNVADNLSLHGAILEIPALKRGTKQLSLQEIEESKRLSKVRIHVERVIGLMKNKYTILQGKLPITILTHKDDFDDYAFIDRIIVVCAALCNLSPSVVFS